MLLLSIPARTPGRCRLRDLGTAGQPDLGDVLIARYALPLGTPCLRAAHELIRGPDVMGSPHGYER